MRFTVSAPVSSANLGPGFEALGLALSLWNPVKGSYSQDEQAYLWGRMALHASRRHDPRAVEWYTLAGSAELSKEQLEWKARSALRARNWTALQAAVAAMPPEQREEPAWRFWNGRAYKEQGQIPAANAARAKTRDEKSIKIADPYTRPNDANAITTETASACVASRARNVSRYTIPIAITKNNAATTRAATTSATPTSRPSSAAHH